MSSAQSSYKQSSRVINSLANSSLLNSYTAWLVFAFGMCITIGASMYMKSIVDNLAEQDFIFHCNDTQSKILDRLDDHARILLSGAALFDASDTVTREKWRVFTQKLDTEKKLPGIQGFGFSMVIGPEELSRHVQQIRAEGFPGYNVRPEGKRELYSSIIFLEPFSDRNLRAFGYDMYSESVRRTAMEQARDTASASLSGKVTLVQETNKDVQAGTLMYVPVYKKGMPTDTIERRRSALLGWVYSPYRMNDLIEKIISGNHNQLKEHIIIQIFDGSQIDTKNLLYESHKSLAQEHPGDIRFIKKIPVSFNGKLWTLVCSQKSASLFSKDFISVWLTTVGGFWVNLLLLILIRTLLKTNNEARSLVEKRTLELYETSTSLGNEINNLNNRLTLATEAAQIGVWDWLVPENKLIWDRWMYTLYGVNENDYPVTYDAWTARLHPDDVERGNEEINKALSGEKTFNTEFRVVWPSGELHYIKANAQVIRDTTGAPLRMIGVNYDITERKQTEEILREQANLLELEMAKRQQSQEALAVKQMQLQELNNSLKALVSEEVRKNREKDEMLIRQDKMSSIGQLSAGVAHEINNPMAFIASNLGSLEAYLAALKEFYKQLQDLIKNNCDEDVQLELQRVAQKLDITFILGDITSLISESLDGAKRVKQIVNGLKEFARVEDNSFSFANLNDCIHNSINMVKNEIKYVADIDLQLDDTPQINCSSSRICQVIINLLVNAAHSITNHGHITISTQQDGNFVILTISDTGHGMPEDIIKRIFDPFFTTKEVGRGTGLGLSISYGIIKEHGGEISVKSSEGVGTVFTIKLPINGNQEQLS